MSSYKRTTLTRLEVPPTIPPEAPFVIDDFALALTLGVRCKTLWYCISRKAHLYKRFTIPKKSGKKRIIFNPRPVLKHLQQRLNETVLKQVTTLDCVGAYVVGKSCRDSAMRHAGHKIRIAMDLKDFFPSHSRARVRHYFKEVIGYSHQVAGLIADLCTAPEKIEGPKPHVKHIVPQGSPASPTLCNLIAQEYLDKPVLAALEGSGWVYTRYSDDISLSHPEVQGREEVDALIELMRKLILGAGYRTNKEKTKVQRHYRRQQMLGMVINSDHPNIPADIYRRYRAILHNCVRDGFECNAVRYGFEPVEGFLAHLQGKIAYFGQVNPAKAGKLKSCLAEAIAIHGEDITDDPAAA
jgi:RNA-directed DNA polymerase